MAIEITIPRLGWSIEEGVFVEWLKGDGERVEPGDPLFSIESEKADAAIAAMTAAVTTPRRAQPLSRIRPAAPSR